MRSLDVVFTKFDSSLHWHYPMWHLGEDTNGTWLGAPAGTMLRKGHLPSQPARGAFVTLVRSGARSMPTWNAPGSYRWSVYVDVCGPVSVTRDRVDAVDLDLDVVRDWEGAVEVLDRDEFSEHAATLSYPDDLVAATESEALRVAEAMRQRTAPYALNAESWLARLDVLEPASLLDDPTQAR